jgi:hypothetical protein
MSGWPGCGGEQSRMGIDGVGYYGFVKFTLPSNKVYYINGHLSVVKKKDRFSCTSKTHYFRPNIDTLLIWVRGQKCPPLEETLE